MVHDITARKQIEDALKFAKMEWERTFDSVPDLIAVIDNEHRVLRVNAPMARLLGHTTEECVGLKCYEVMHGTDAPLGTCPHSLTINDGREHTREVHEDRFGLDLQVTTTPLTDEQGRMIGSVHVAHDITERKRADETLRQWNERHEILAEAARLLLSSETPEQMVQVISERVMEHLECHAFFNFLVEEGTERMHLNAYAGIPEETAREIEWLDFGVAVCGCVARDGKRIIAEDIANIPDARTELVKSFGIQAYACHPLIYQDRTIGTLSFGTCERPRFSEDDVTLMRAVASLVATAMARRRIEDDLARAKDLAEDRAAALETAIQDLEGFTYSVSHDLRAPIRHITSFSHLLQKKCWSSLDEKGRQYMETISGSSRKLGILMDELLEFSRMGRVPLKKSEVNLQALTGEVVKSFDEQTEARRIEWTIGSLPTVEGDTSMLRLVFANLLSNAVKFTSKKEEVRIEIGHRKEDNIHVIFVKDNGAGFDMRFVDKLFGVFQRLHHETDFEGTGIGLANVARIIHRHGGQVWAEGKVDEGAVFSFTLPKHIPADGASD
jgi:PAS domain S-box-containing protein